MKRDRLGLRISMALLFLAICGCMMFGIYKLSSENGVESNSRSTTVTEVLKRQVENKLESNEVGTKFSEKVKYYVIKYSPYGSDWNANIRKLAHFSIYFLLAFAIYVTLSILGVNMGVRFFITISICFMFAFGDEFHQRFTGRGASFDDVLLDTFGSLVSTCLWTFIALIVRLIKYILHKVDEAYQ